MKKNKKVKESFDNVVIKNVELTPTTIGKVDSNESGLKSVLILFVSLFIIIFVLPYAVNLINNFRESETPPPVVVPETPTETLEPPVENPTKEEIEFSDINSPILRIISGYRYDITADLNAKMLNVKVTNVSGSATLLISTPMYIELYNSDKTLLDRILITKREIVSDSTVEFKYNYKDGTNSNQTPAYLTITAKGVNDYPAVTLQTSDSSNSPSLTCVKDNETLIYNFKEDDNEYLLTDIIERISVSSSDEEVINTYEAKIAGYNSIDGVDSEFTPKNNGFVFEAKINLSKVSISERKRILNNYAFYEKDTLAKTIAFELNSSGYNCQ